MFSLMGALCMGGHRYSQQWSRARFIWLKRIHPSRGGEHQPANEPYTLFDLGSGLERNCNKLQHSCENPSSMLPKNFENRYS